MEKQLITEEAVKDMLGIPDFRHLKKEQIIEFVSNIPNMDPEVAKRCIEQFPNFKEYASSIMSRLQDSYDRAINKSHIDSIKAYKDVLDILKNLIEKEYLSESERTYIIEKMIEVAQHLEDIDGKRDAFAQRLLQFGSAVAVVAIGVGGAALGMKMDIKPAEIVKAIRK